MASFPLFIFRWGKNNTWAENILLLGGGAACLLFVEALLSFLTVSAVIAVALVCSLWPIYLRSQPRVVCAWLVDFGVSLTPTSLNSVRSHTWPIVSLKLSLALMA